MSSVAEIMKACRKSAGFTQGDLARRTGVALSTLSRWEQGKFMPSVSDFRLVLNVCGYDIQIVRLTTPGQAHDDKERK